MQFFVLVVQRRGQVKVAHHVARGLAGGRVAALVQQMLLQFGLQAEHALDTLVASGQHLERFFKTCRRRAVAGQHDGAAASRFEMDGTAHARSRQPIWTGWPCGSNGM